MYIKGRYIVSACALLFIQHVAAAGMDCTKASKAEVSTSIGTFEENGDN